MTERDLEKKCMGELERQLPQVLLWKIHDAVTGGQPDLEVNWSSATSKIEFKVLRGVETIHQKWEDGRQLTTLVQYENTTGRAWAVAYRFKSLKHGRAVDETLIYRPSKLLHGNLPTSGRLWNDAPFRDALIALWEVGVIRYEGFRHEVVAALIKATHQ